MQFREAIIADIPALTDLRMDFLAEGFPAMTKEEAKIIRASLPEYYKRHLTHDLLAFVAAEKDEIISTVFLQSIENPASPNYKTGKTGMILNVYTRPDFSIRGMARGRH